MGNRQQARRRVSEDHARSRVMGWRLGLVQGRTVCPEDKVSTVVRARQGKAKGDGRCQVVGGDGR